MTNVGCLVVDKVTNYSSSTVLSRKICNLALSCNARGTKTYAKFHSCISLGSHFVRQYFLFFDAGLASPQNFNKSRPTRTLQGYLGFIWVKLSFIRFYKVLINLIYHCDYVFTIDYKRLLGIQTGNALDKSHKGKSQIFRKSKLVDWPMLVPGAKLIYTDQCTSPMCICSLEQDAEKVLELL